MSTDSELRVTYTPAPVLLAEAEIQNVYAELGSLSDLYTEVQQEIEENLALEKDLHALLVKRLIHDGSVREKQLQERHKAERDEQQNSWNYERARLQAQLSRLEQQSKEKDAVISQLQAEKSDAIQTLLTERREAETVRREDRRGKDLEKQLREERAQNEQQQRSLQLQVRDLEDQLSVLQASRSELLRFLSTKLNSNNDAPVLNNLDHVATELRARSPMSSPVATATASNPARSVPSPFPPTAHTTLPFSSPAYDYASARTALPTVSRSPYPRP